MVDASTVEVLADEELPGFNRLDAAGDGRRFLVSAHGGFRLLDGGAWTEPHGDHAHHHTADPELTDVVVEAEKPGHVVAHAGRTVPFDDGTGEVTASDSAAVADPDRETWQHRTPSPRAGAGRRDLSRAPAERPGPRGPRQRRARTASASAPPHPATTTGVSTGSNPPGRIRTRLHRSLR